ncbi:MAG TPA: SDR family NAD(P)-dependent oxidoreductase [Vicinamibacterales bacterium]|nr:SDR family NAD(P)-dependent oxidoreductase [Vicinamibacterales bacterium]
MPPLAGRVVAITGASAGIGSATAEVVAQRGAAVVLNARRGDRLEALARRIEAAGGRAAVEPGDVTREADLARLVDRALGTFGRLDAIVCNAGIGYHGGLLETPPEAARRLMDVNFFGTYHAIRAALPVFLRQRHGHVVIVSSIVGRRGVGYAGVYSATKAAQVGLGQGLRAELRGTGVAVSVVCPISTETEFHEAMTREFGRLPGRTRGPRQPAAAVARAIAACLERPRAEVMPYPAARLLVVLDAVAPALADRLVGRYGRRAEDAPSNP